MRNGGEMNNEPSCSILWFEFEIAEAEEKEEREKEREWRVGSSGVHDCEMRTAKSERVSDNRYCLVR